MNLVTWNLKAGIPSRWSGSGKFFRFLSVSGTVNVEVHYPDSGLSQSSEMIGSIGLDLRNPDNGDSFNGLTFLSPIDQEVKFLVSSFPTTDTRLYGDIEISGSVNSKMVVPDKVDFYTVLARGFPVDDGSPVSINDFMRPLINFGAGSRAVHSRSIEMLTDVYLFTSDQYLENLELTDHSLGVGLFGDSVFFEAGTVLEVKSSDVFYIARRDGVDSEVKVIETYSEV